MALRTLRRQTLNLSLRAVCRKLVIDFAMLVSWNIYFYMFLYLRSGLLTNSAYLIAY